ncbi:beta-N-acetylhexosaminidase [Baekduia soli]|uniref:Beta-N-acetylhexosaminidase n=1 Tax=Baekduia soli TaxID=496014 RepID=A0A5B8U6Z4_9ACTN|nr:glycoside hydrolase family 3 N-terminal domain-containing protein [Baekduia soli]QEC48866.1 beta-N-acetylhexosaminidase [Baekduia soli]
MRRALGALGAAGAALALLGGGCGGGGGPAGGPAHRRGGPAATTSPASGAGTTTAPAVRTTLRQAIGQRFVFAFTGAQPPAALRRRIARGEAAGVILFGRNVRDVAQVRRTVGSLQAIRRPDGLDVPLLVMVDQEGGPVRRLAGPPAAAAGDTAGTTQARANGRAAAGLLRAAGINVDLAPVVDVARPGTALLAERRAYGTDPATVAARAGAFAAGLRTGGVQPVLKHFPGLGAAAANTDDGAVRIDLTAAELRRVDAAPYRGIRAPAVMVSTAVYPRVDPRPAAFSERWVTRELRGALGFDGVTITDDLQAPAVTSFGTPAQLAFFAMRAGVDLPLFAKSYTAGARAAAGLERAVRTGALPRAALDAGVRRVLAWRGRLPVAAR